MLVSVVVACGGSAGPTTKSPVANTVGVAPSPARDQIVNEAIVALAAGKVEKLMELADPKGLYEKAIICTEDDGDSNLHDLERELRKEFTYATEKAKGSTVEVVSIKNEIRSWTTHSGGRDRNADFVAKGGSISKHCTARTDLMFHQVEVRLHVKGSDANDEVRVSLDLINAKGRWYVIKVPKDLAHGGASSAMAMMGKFSKQMCECKDKACADKVNEDMSKWGMEMAKSAGSYDERPDPDMARRSAEIMTRYTECMTKLMMMGAGTP